MEKTLPLSWNGGRTKDFRYQNLINLSSFALFFHQLYNNILTNSFLQPYILKIIPIEKYFNVQFQCLCLQWLERLCGEGGREEIKIWLVHRRKLRFGKTSVRSSASDWLRDVWSRRTCSAGRGTLTFLSRGDIHLDKTMRRQRRIERISNSLILSAKQHSARRWAAWKGEQARSEERRVGKECRSRWSPYH